MLHGQCGFDAETSEYQSTAILVGILVETPVKTLVGFG